MPENLLPKTPYIPYPLVKTLIKSSFANHSKYVVDFRIYSKINDILSHIYLVLHGIIRRVFKHGPYSRLYEQHKPKTEFDETFGVANIIILPFFYVKNDKTFLLCDKINYC